MNRELSDVIGKDRYYTQMAQIDLKITSENGSGVDGRAYTYKINKAKDGTQVGKYGLTTTYEQDGKSKTDTYIGDTQGELLAVLRNLKDQEGDTATVVLPTKTYSDAAPLAKKGTTVVDTTVADKEWKAAGGNTVTKGNTSVNKWDALAEETNQNGKPELSTSNLKELPNKTKVLENIEGNIQLTFNESLGNPGGVKLMDTKGTEVKTDDTEVPAAVTLEDDPQTPNVSNNKITIDPEAPLTAGGKYQVRNSGDTKLADLAVTPNPVSDPVVDFSAAGTPAASSVPAVAEANTNLGKVDATAADASVGITFDKNIAAVNDSAGIIVNNGTADVTLTNTQYEISGTTLKIKKEGLTALGITDNSVTDRALSLKDGQIADATNANQKNVATNLTFKTKASAAAGSAPAVSNPNLGELDIYDASGKVKAGANLNIKFDKDIKAVDSNGNIIVRADGGAVTLTTDMYKINKNSLSINGKGIDHLKLTPGGNITVKAGQVATTDGTPTSSDITVSHTEKAEVSSPSPSPSPSPSAPDAKPTANIITPPISGFPKAGPIELTFENVIKLAEGKKLDDSTVSVYAVDGNTKKVIVDTKQAGLQYAIKDNKLTITRSSGEFLAETRYRVAIKPDVLLNDDGKGANPTPVTYDFIAKTPTL
jgi:methionine-rich copper-binding protein CopC